jgi:hypothetical protein
VFSRHNERGQEVLQYMCHHCGSTLAAESPKYPGLIVVKYGTLDSTDGLGVLRRTDILLIGGKLA